jgi:hypothetical protein
MSEATRDRSPAFPVVPLDDALERLVQFENHFKRSGARPEKVGDAWSIKTKAYADRIAAALRYFGLLDYQGGGTARSVVVSEDGRKYLRAQQDETKREIIRAAALRPKQIAKFWGDWGNDRPADAACLDELTLKNGFSDGGARDFLKVYDATISFAGLSDADKVPPEIDEGEAGEAERSQESARPDAPPRATHAAIPARDAPPIGRVGGIALMQNERELTTGLLSKDASFRLIVSGHVGEKEIERLIRKLELDKEILAEGAEALTPPRPLVTSRQREQLRTLGWEEDDIDGMTYEEVVEAIQTPRVPSHVAR